MQYNVEYEFLVEKKIQAGYALWSSFHYLSISKEAHQLFLSICWRHIERRITYDTSICKSSEKILWS